MKPGVTRRSCASMRRAAVAPARRADRGDAIAGDAEVGADPGVARAIHDACVVNQDIEVRRLDRLSREGRHCKADRRDDPLHGRVL